MPKNKRPSYSPLLTKGDTRVLQDVQNWIDSALRETRRMNQLHDLLAAQERLTLLIKQFCLREW